jgi:hypothetical protein
MRSRFLISVAIADLTSLAVAVALTSVYVFGVFLPWTAQPGTEVIPLLLLMAGSMVVASWLTESMSAHGVPRPTYGRMLYEAAALRAQTRDCGADIFLRTAMPA